MPEIPADDLKELQEAALALANPTATHEERVKLLTALYWVAYSSGALQAVRELRNPLADPKSHH